MNIKQAYLKSKRELGRSSAGLDANTELGLVDRKGTTTLLARCKVTGGDRMHRCMIEYAQEGDKSKRVLDYRTEKRVRISPLRKPYACKVHCDCQDFQFTFYPAIAKEHSNIKVIAPVEVKGTGKPRAIKEIGICKHLMALVDDLRGKGLIV